ncbi:MAG: GGDEF domain-containing protein [Firmicutes bacterium]|nr:GGDEF domain-containing protein [Bacillota bacterium]
MAVRKNITEEINRDNFIGSAIINGDSVLIIADEAVYSFLGIAQSAALKDYIHPDDRALFVRQLETCQESPAVFLCSCKRYDGTYKEISVLMRSKNIDDKAYIEIVMYEVVFLTRQFEKFVANNKIFNALITMSDKIFFRYEPETGNMYVYNGRETIYNGSMELYRETIINQGSVSKESIPRFIDMCDEIEKAQGDGSYKIDTLFFNADNDKEFYPTTVNFTAIEFNTQVKYIIGMFACNIAGNAADSYISNRSNLDPLTSLLNKKAIKDYALESLARAAKDGSTVTFVMIDLDNFKTINDTYGHMFGDETLVSVARVLNEAVGDKGIVGRIGGDEFFIVLTGFEDGNDAIRPLIRSIRSHVEWCFKNKLDDIKVTCSVGTSTFPTDARNYDDLFKLADHCLYVAKSKGRDRFIIYTKEMHGSLEEILSSGTVIQMANFVSEADKSKHLLSIIQRFNSAGEYDTQQVILKKVMLELLYYYDIDFLQYAPADEKEQSYEVANYKIAPPETLMKLYDGYKDEFNSKNYLTIGNYENAKTEHPVLHNYMLENELFSLMMIKYADDDGTLRGIFAVSTRKRYQKWAAFDINMLLIIFRLMERFV